MCACGRTRRVLCGRDDQALGAIFGRNGPAGRDGAVVWGAGAGGTEPMSRGVPFQPGNKLGRGRPRGGANKSSLPGSKLLVKYGEAVVRKCIAMALKENSVAM